MPKPSDAGAYWRDGTSPYLMPGLNDREGLIYSYVDEIASIRPYLSLGAGAFVAGSHTLTAADWGAGQLLIVGVTDTSAQYVVILPAAATLANGSMLFVKDESIAASGNPITVTAANGETIDNYQALVLQTDGAAAILYVGSIGWAALTTVASTAAPVPIPPTPVIT